MSVDEDKIAAAVLGVEPEDLAKSSRFYPEYRAAKDREEALAKDLTRRAAENMLRDQGAHAEREAVVKYLRACSERYFNFAIIDGHQNPYDRLADAIEKGEHRHE